MGNRSKGLQPQRLQKRLEKLEELVLAQAQAFQLLDRAIVQSTAECVDVVVSLGSAIGLVPRLTENNSVEWVTPTTPVEMPTQEETTDELV